MSPDVHTAPVLSPEAASRFLVTPPLPNAPVRSPEAIAPGAARRWVANRHVDATFRCWAVRDFQIGWLETHASRHYERVRRGRYGLGIALAYVAFLSPSCSDDADSVPESRVDDDEPTTAGERPSAGAVLDFDGTPELRLGTNTRSPNYEGPRLTQEGDVLGSCVLMTVDSPGQLQVIVVDGIVEVIELRGDGTTVAGVGPGASRAAVLAAHAEANVSEVTNRFADAAVVVPQDDSTDPPSLHYVLDEAAQKVTVVRAGRSSSLANWDEGCA